MTITNIEKQKKNTKRYSVFIDDEFAFGLDEMDVLSLRLSLGMTLTEQDYHHMLDEVVFSDGKKKALRYLSYQGRTEKEVREKLKEDYPAETIDKIILFLKTYKFLDDIAYARLYIEEKVNLRRYAPQKIRFELMKKGIAAPVVEAQFLQIDLKITENILYFLDRAGYDPADKKDAEKITAKLLRKGFSYQDIKEAVKLWEHGEKR